MAEVGNQLLGYEVLGLLGKNLTTHVEVQAARCLSTGKEVAVKCFEDNSIGEIENLVKKGLVQGRVDHENNCRLVELRVTRVGTTSPTWAVRLIMEKMPMDIERDLEDRRNLRRFYTETELLKFLFDVAKGLAHAKMNVSLTQNIAHLDLKPQNIYLDNDGNYKVGDFGTSWQKIERESTDYEAGTPLYMSPELWQMLTDPQGKKNYKPFESDVFSLGMTLFALTRLSPPTNRNEAAITKEIRGLPYSQDFKAFLERMLQVDPNNRPTIEEVVAFANPARYEEEKQNQPSARRAPPSQPLKTPDLPCVQRDSLRFFNFGANQWSNPQRLSTVIPFDKWTRYILLGDNRVFCCGSLSNIYTDSKAAANILARDGTVEQLKDMIYEHIYAGIVFVANRNSVYVFGSN